jgi:hypothetical protein
MNVNITTVNIRMMHIYAYLVNRAIFCLFQGQFLNVEIERDRYNTYLRRSHDHETSQFRFWYQQQQVGFHRWQIRTMPSIFETSQCHRRSTYIMKKRWQSVSIYRYRCPRIWIAQYTYICPASDWLSSVVLAADPMDLTDPPLNLC